MKNIKAALVIMSTLLFSLACAYNRVKYEPTASTVRNVQNGPSVALQVEWLKNKKDTIDLLVYIANDYEHPVLVKDGSFQLAFAGTNASPHGRTGVSELQPGDTVKKVLIFKMGENKPREGEAILSVDGIFKGTIESTGEQLPPLSIRLPVTAR